MWLVDGDRRNVPSVGTPVAVFSAFQVFSPSRTRSFSVMDIVYEYESLWHESLWGNLAAGACG
jgi:hypothetical protein